MATNADADTFLTAHPEAMVGRDALEEARSKVDTENTFTIVSKSVINIVLIQDFDADTKERLHAVALVDDLKAEEYYRQNNQGENITAELVKCKDCGSSGPSHCLFERAP
ncbi:hypothetical protein B0T10DRAFT_490358 [Thelonectria olida]|uniref:Uncharacterized protein n=1 Tax=Thelonectria olida TaxID=1576542 RepID=A0A9P9ANK3_9HYPO|nr:hypothetical protein B0T10DRAFT_490358 [Thelonectria olida]